MVDEIIIKRDELFKLPYGSQNIIFYELLASLAYAYSLGTDIPRVKVARAANTGYYVLDNHRAAAQLLVNRKVGAIVSDKINIPYKKSPFSVKVNRESGILEEFCDRRICDRTYIPFNEIPLDFIRGLEKKIAEAEFLSEFPKPLNSLS